MTENSSTGQWYIIFFIINSASKRNLKYNRLQIIKMIRNMFMLLIVRFFEVANYWFCSILHFVHAMD